MVAISRQSRSAVAESTPLDSPQWFIIAHRGRQTDIENYNASEGNMSGKNGSIMLFVRNLPTSVTRRDLRQFIQRELKQAGIRGLPLMSTCTSCCILQITDPATGSREYHGLVEMQPARIALQAIAILNGKEIAGTPMEVRRYRHRSTWGMYNGCLLGQSSEADAIHERRRPNLRIELVDATPSVEVVDGEPVLT
jgi:RNA recognition motif-containing protein